MATIKDIYLIFVVFMVICIPTSDSIAVMSVDIGSEWLKIAIVKPGVPMEIALNKESRRKTPFVVAMRQDERTFSDPALGLSVKHPPSAYVYLTHLLGKKYDGAAVQLYKKRFPYYNLVKDEKRGTVLFKADNGVTYSVEELVAMVLNSTRHIAQNFANHQMKDAVLTVPVYFNQAERKSLLAAANMTSLNILQLMNDNTAVALNYGIFRAATFNGTMKHILFFDMGASHTTATVVGYSTTKVKDRGYLETIPQLVIKGVGFDTELGGLEMDIRIRDHLVKAFKNKYKTKNEITENPRAMAKMLKEAKRIRQVLSANAEHNAQIENVFEEKDFRMKLQRSELEEMCKDLFDNVHKPVKMALDAASMTLDDIESVILMGGGSRIPKVQQNLLKFVKKEELGKSINTDEAAALGAVYKAADLTAGFKVKRFLVKDLNLFPIDVKFQRESDEDNSVRIITRNLYHRLNPLPQKKVMTFNKKPYDFHFNVSYGDLTFLTPELKEHLTLDRLSHVKLTGVDAAHEKNAKGIPKGVKAYFSLDDSGILRIEKVQAHFEKTADAIKEEEQSTFQKLGSKLSSFFGSSKKEDESVERAPEEPKVDETKPKEAPKDEVEKKEEKTDDKKKDDTVKSNSTTDSKNITAANETTNGNKTEEVKPPKPVVVKEEIQIEYRTMDLPHITKENFDLSVKKLNELEARDQSKLATEAARNSLESYIFEFKDKLYQDNVQKFATDDERAAMEKALIQASDWLDEDGFDADEKTFKAKLKDLKETTHELQFRLDEHAKRPQAIASVLQSLNISNVFFDSIKTMPDAKDIYTEKDLKDLEKIRNETKDWLTTTWKKQNETDPTKKPVLLTKDIVAQQGRLDRELVYLINKAKYYVPKPKPKTNTTATNTTDTKNLTDSTTAEKTGETDKERSTYKKDVNEESAEKEDKEKSTEKDNKKEQSAEKEQKKDKFANKEEKANESSTKQEKKDEEKEPVFELSGGSPTQESKEAEIESENESGNHRTPEDEL